jgi:hypothetical protein
MIRPKPATTTTTTTTTTNTTDDRHVCARDVFILW